MRGPTDRVWVTVMCRRRLFESRSGTKLTCLVRLIPASLLMVTPLVLLPSCPSIPRRVSTMPPPIDRRGNRPNRRNITFKRACIPPRLMFPVYILMFLMITELSAGRLR